MEGAGKCSWFVRYDKQLEKYSSEECIVEVCDRWLNLQPDHKPTWRDVANIVNDVGLCQLGDDILMAYKTGCYNK